MKSIVLRLFGACLLAGLLVMVLPACPKERRDGSSGKEEVPAASGGDEDKPPSWPLLDLTAANLEKEAVRLRRMLGMDYVVVVESPFVICGDIADATMRRLVEHTIKDCYKAMEADFFSKNAVKHVHRIFLFNNPQSYKKGALRLFDDEAGSPYGYFTTAERSLVMNIATGGGTLVHEMVHAMIHYDFPTVPTWLNEGIASLFECCTVRDGSIYGLVNWRLPVFEKGFEKGDFVRLEELLTMPDRTFRNSSSSMHYAESRYFCMYMQERKLLRGVYAEFRDNAPTDPWGVETVKKAFGQPLDRIEKDWLDWVGTQEWK